MAHASNYRKKPSPHAHVLSHMKWIAEGGDGSRWTDDDLIKDLRADTSAMTDEEVNLARRLGRTGAKKAKEAWSAGQQNRARQIATETAQAMVDLLDGRYTSEERDEPSDPRGLASLIRRR